MNYRHAFHAGHFADVFKHVALILLLESLLTKDKPFCYLDTHAGTGRYDLKSREALKTKESETGIVELMGIKGKKPKVITQYLHLVSHFNESKQLRYYPGSPRIARSLLRPDDKMILTELHPEDARTLKNEFKHDKQTSVHLLDGYQGLKAFLPPNPRRGLVLIDPPFENPKEFDVLIKSLKMAIQRWSTGIYMVWYPVKTRYLITAFERKLKNLSAKEILIAELCLFPDDSPLALNGSGLAIINPPWQFEKKLQEVLPWLLTALDKNKIGHFRLDKIGSTKRPV